MKTSVQRGRWGWLVGVLAAALCACGGGAKDGGAGPAADPQTEAGGALTEPRPDDSPSPASEGTEAIASSSSSGPEALVASRDLPLVNRLGSNAGVSDPTHKPWCLDVRAVAIEGEVAPGTGGQTFDHQSEESDLKAQPVGYRYGFDEPMVNESGNIAFIASYGHEYVTGTAAAQGTSTQDPTAASGAPATDSAASDATASGATSADPAASDATAAASSDQSSADPAASGASGSDPAARSLLRQCPGAGVFFWDRDEDRLSPVGIAGQYTDAGILPDRIDDYDGPQINDRDRVAFVARNLRNVDITAPTDTFVPTEGYCNAALFQGIPKDEKCERFDLRVIAQTGDRAPGGGYFVSFDDLAENERGDIAFIAFYTQEAVVPGATFKELSTAGVFLYKSDSHQIVAIIRDGAPLPGTNGGFFCNDELVDGPWLNDDRVVTFIADCVEDSTGQQHLTDFEGSVFIKRPGEDVELFLKNNSPGPRVTPCGECSYEPTDSYSTITEIETGRPGISEDLMVFKLQLETGMTYQNVIATKRLSSDADGKLKVCAFDGEELKREDTLGVETPSISSDNIIGIPGTVNGWVDGCFKEQDTIFNCTDGSLKQLVRYGDPKPVGKNNTFGSVEEQSNSDRYEVFLDETESPTGVYTSNTHPQRE